MANKTKTLEDWRAVIEREARDIMADNDVRPYSHSIISIVLRAIAERWGQAEANRAIKDFGLEDLGWSKRDSVKD